MIHEDYVSFEVAKLLKEKGFNDVYPKGDCIQYACRLQMAMKWLREMYNLFIQIEYDIPTFSADIYKMNEIDEYCNAKHIPYTFANAKSYEQVANAALKYVLENLENLLTFKIKEES